MTCINDSDFVEQSNKSSKLDPEDREFDFSRHPSTNKLPTNVEHDHEAYRTTLNSLDLHQKNPDEVHQMLVLEPETLNPFGISIASHFKVDRICLPQGALPRPSMESRRQYINMSALKKTPKKSRNTSKYELSFSPTRNVDSDKQLMEAARRGNCDRVRQLVLNHSGPHSSDWSGMTALHVAAQKGHKEVVKILLDEGVNHDTRTKVDRTALHLAAQYGHLDVVNLLINHLSDVNATDMLKMSPLHWATDKGHVDVVERLLQAGADMTLESKFQLTPIDIAYHSQFYEIIDLFKKYSTDIPSSLCSIGRLYGYQGPKYLSSNGIENESLLGHSDQSCITPVHSASTSHSNFDLEDSCIDLEFEWKKLELPKNFFLESVSGEEEPQIEYLMKIVEELQKENKHLRLKVEQLSTNT